MSLIKLLIGKIYKAVCCCIQIQTFSLQIYVSNRNWSLLQSWKHISIHNNVTVVIEGIQVSCLWARSECSGSVSRALLDLGSKGCWFKPYRRWSHCVVSFSKILYSLLSPVSTQEDLSQHGWKKVDWDVKNRTKQTNKIGKTWFGGVWLQATNEN